jgi:4-hydroxyphenylpyruvate dioxygenase-like putative hemolysin
MTFHGKPVTHKFVGAATMVGDLNVELIMHLRGKTIYKEFLDKKGEGLHHIAYTTNDIDPALEEFRKSGIRVLQSGKVAKDA